ncbi:MAG TPA: UvrD-helicase domain-containing protein, partial [Quisquiliibacterium sp.]|nr:UvrD-helicase domain-containing protein [Quisquiliibacterium sp.]
GVLEFEDLLLRMREALADPHHGPRFAALLQMRYPLVLIDECQDTDPLQWEVFRRIHFGGAMSAAAAPAPFTAASSERSSPAGMSSSGASSAAPSDHGLIVVGDPKQSIYGFRGADVFAYLDARDQGGRRHRLTENQRSDRALIDGLNVLFGRDDPFLIEQIEFARASAADRRRGAFVDPGGAGRGPMTMVAIGVAAGADAGRAPSGDVRAGKSSRSRDQARPLTTERATEIAARACACEIARLLGPTGACLDGRPLRPSDIAVLVHRHAEGAAVKRELAALGIGAVELSRDSVFRSRQADELLRLIGALARPARVELLRGALATRLLGWRADALVGDARHDDRLSGAARVFAAAREQWFEAGPMAALRAVLHHWGGFARLAGEEEGERVLTNVLHLLELLAASPEARLGPQAAQRWLARRIEGDTADEASELRLDSDARLVNVVTIHRSKGLEYPVVLLPFAWTARRHRRRGRPDQGVLWHTRDAHGWRAVRTFGDTGADDAGEAEASAAREHHAEALRQFYVAVTRARHRCYVFWGAASGSARAPLAWLLHGVDPLDGKAVKDFGPADVMPVLHALEAASPAAFGVLDAASIAPPADATRGQGDADAQALAARAFSGVVPIPWQRRSFSSLLSSVRAAQDEAGLERPDHDEATAPAAPTAADEAPMHAPMTLSADPAEFAQATQIRFAFPAGPEAGNCLHAILEHTDFTAGVSADRVRDALLRSGFVDVDPLPVVRWLDAVLATPLRGLRGESLTLSSLARADTVRELAFELRARDADARRIAASVAQHYPLPFAPESIGAARWSGYLRGYVDLVFRVDGRYYLADWKSNLLGGSFDDYGPRALSEAMRAHGYALQFCLYALALHRHLAARMPHYHYDTHFGGVFYLFLRGVGPAPHGVAGTQTGVHAARPPYALIRALDALLPGVDEAGAS